MIDANGSNSPIDLDHSKIVTLIRHGATLWSKTGQHTGRTNLELSDEGVLEAKTLRKRLQDTEFDEVVTSPLKRAVDTAGLAGLTHIRTDANLEEWDYGEFEGLTTIDIRGKLPDWNLFIDGVMGGESIAEVALRADLVLSGLSKTGNSCLVAHGHILRVIAARWLLLPPSFGMYLNLSPASISELGFEREIPVIKLWNKT